MGNDPRTIGEKLAEIDRKAHETTPERGAGQPSERAKDQDEHERPMTGRDRGHNETSRPSRKS
jgi:hypothetical protein